MLVAAIATGLALLAADTSCRRSERPPNVLVVVLDTVRADRTSLGGYRRVTTPRLDEFARDAVTFDEAWSPGSWTVPAHAGLFTGVAPHRLDLFRGLTTELRGGTTLAERLSAAGFDTGAFSANPWVGPHAGLTRGFDTVWQASARGAEFPRAEEVFGAARAWISGLRASRPDRPWFAFANVMEAHSPYDPPPEVSARFLRAGIPAPAVAAARELLATTGLFEASLDDRPLAPDVDAAVSDLYDGEVASADAALGRFLDVLHVSGVLDRTLVIVASDHGEGLGDHGWREHGVRLHRELLHVPLVARLPGRFDGGRRVATLVRLEDVTPTALACCGLDPVPGLDGRDLAAPVAGRLAFATDRPYGGWPQLAAAPIPEHARAELKARRYSAFDGRFHAVFDDRGPAELYDVASDPGELRNLAADDAPTLERLRSEVTREFGVLALPR